MLTPEDVAYIESNFRRLEELRAERDMSPSDLLDLRTRRLLPLPTYVLDDSSEMVPQDYFDLLDAANQMLIDNPRRADEGWARELRAAVDSLDALERDFAPFDRVRWGPVSRDRLITAVRDRYPEAFGGAEPSGLAAGRSAQPIRSASSTMIPSGPRT